MYKPLPKSEIENPNSLDAIFKEMHIELQKRKVPMTEEQTRYSLSIMLAKEDAIEMMFVGFSDKFPINGFFSRCTIFPIQYEKRLLLWLALMTHEFAIGGMILVGYYVQWWAFNEIGPVSELSLDVVVERCFPFGIFNKELVHEFWDKQKVAAQPDNLIDHASAGLSFMPQKVPA